MNDLSWDDPLPELDRLLRDAGNYVQPSEDLRPRVLEAARAQHFERKTRRRLAQAALLLLLLTVGSVAGLRSLGAPPADGAEQRGNQASATDPAAPAKPPVDANWETVEKYRQLRLRQARMLSLPL